MPMEPTSSRSTIPFTHYMVRAFALNGGRSSRKGKYVLRVARRHHRRFPIVDCRPTKSPDFTIGPPLTSAVALAEFRRLLDSQPMMLPTDKQRELAIALADVLLNAAIDASEPGSGDDA